MDPLLVLLIAIAALAVIIAVVAAAVARRASLAARLVNLPDLAGRIDRVQSELRGLSELFLVPRTRGVVGETMLEELLSSWLPKGSFSMQHGFANGTRVDAVIRLGNRLVPVDSKFPLESFSRMVSAEGAPAEEAQPGAVDSTPTAGGPLPADVRRAFIRHASDIAERYIRPDEGTLGFALMYIPSERIYVELFVDRPGELYAEAVKRNVVPVSPGTLFLYLQTVAYGLRGLALPEQTTRLLRAVDALRTELAGFSKSFAVAGTHLRNLGRAYDEAASRLGRLEILSERLTAGERDDG